MPYQIYKIANSVRSQARSTSPRDRWLLQRDESYDKEQVFLTGVQNNFEKFRQLQQQQTNSSPNAPQEEQSQANHIVSLNEKFKKQSSSPQLLKLRVITTTTGIKKFNRSVSPRRQ